MTRLVTSPFWNSQTAADKLRRVREYEDARTWRPTAVVPIIDHAGRPLVVLDFATGMWGNVQGYIEPTDVHPLAAGRREAYQEAHVKDEAVAGLFPYLGEATVGFIEPRPHATGFTEGGYYVFVGIQLKAGADVSLMPPQGQAQALLDYRWCSSLDQAIDIVRTQPGVEERKLDFRARSKIERVTIPALESIYQPMSKWLLELLEPLT